MRNLNQAVVKAPITGTVLEVKASQGDQVHRDDVLIVIESMKMENEVLCDYDGRVATVNSFVGQSVSEGDELMTLDIG